MARDRRINTQPEPGDPVDRGFIHVFRTAYGHTEETTEEVRVPALADVMNGNPVARVRVGGSVTRNLGDYNSARVEVMIELPCLPESSEVARVVGIISDKLDVMIPQELAKATGQGPADPSGGNT